MTVTRLTATRPTETVPAPRTEAHPLAKSPAPRFRLRTSGPDLLLCGVLLTVILTVQGWNITRFPTFSDDEGTYLAQAWSVQQGRGLAHYTYWYDHPPVGWIQIALITWPASLIDQDAMTLATMRYAMLLVGGISAVLLYVLARRLGLPRWGAGLGMALFGLSPLAVALQREIFLDNIAVMWMLLAFCLAASPRHHLWHHFGAGLAAATSVLSKETMLVVLPALLVTMWQHSHRDTRKFAVTGAVAACGLTGLGYPLYALLNHELFPGRGHVSLIDGIRFQMSREGSGFILAKGTNSHAVFESWLYYDTVLPLGGLAGAVLLLGVLRWSVTARALAGPALAVATLALVAMRPSGYLPAMYVIQVLPFLALIVAGTASSVAHAVLLRGARRGARHGARRGARAFRYARGTLLAALGATVAVLVVSHWYDGDRTALTADANAPYRAAAAWMRDDVADPGRTRALVDDALWLDLVHAGYRPGDGAIWFYKADLDPAVARTLPNGWRDIDYVVASPTVRRDAVDLPTVKAALQHSTPVAVFGEGADRIEIRRIAGGTK